MQIITKRSTTAAAVTVDATSIGKTKIHVNVILFSHNFMCVCG